MPGQKRSRGKWGTQHFQVENGNVDFSAEMNLAVTDLIPVADNFDDILAIMKWHWHDKNDVFRVVEGGRGQISLSIRIVQPANMFQTVNKETFPNCFFISVCNTEYSSWIIQHSARLVHFCRKARSRDLSFSYFHEYISVASQLRNHCINYVTAVPYRLWREDWDVAIGPNRGFAALVSQALKILCKMSHSYKFVFLAQLPCSHLCKILIYSCQTQEANEGQTNGKI